MASSSTSETLAAGDNVIALNLKYKDGTRLRTTGCETSGFNGVWLANDTQVRVLAATETGDFLRVEKSSGETGWIRRRCLTKTERVAGVTKDVVTTELVTPDPEYVKGIKIYGCGIKEDPVPGAKFGKGIQHLISSQWVNAFSQFIGSHFRECQAFARHGFDASRDHPGFDFVYFSNASNALLNRADILGLRSSEAVDYFHMATWLCMAAAEVDSFPFTKYTSDQRAAIRLAFYDMYLSPRPGPGVSHGVPHDDASSLGKFAMPVTRRDLIPPLALERLGINNELSALKYADAELPMREGFRISARMDSLKRHFEGVHKRMYDEDHVIHALWNFHAIFHVLTVFPDKLDLVDYSALHGGVALRPKTGPYSPTTSLLKITSSPATMGTALKLDWNEGVIPPPPTVCQALVHFVQAAEGSFLKWYPHLAGGEDLRNALISYLHSNDDDKANNNANNNNNNQEDDNDKVHKVRVIPENLMVTNGSDDALILICETFLGHGKTALVPCPTYEHFCVNAVCAGASLVRCSPADVFQPDVEWLTTAIEQHRPDVVYLVSPNNPTGVQYSEAMVRSLATRFEGVLFLVDEAYYEFGATDPATGALVTAVPLAVQLRNVVVTRTFSKAFCLAAVRCGYLVAHPSTVELIKARYNPKSINQFAQIAAYHALKELGAYYRPYIVATNAARVAFHSALVQRGIPAKTGGAGNFICIYLPSGRTQAFCDQLELRSIFVRDIGARFPNYIRISIGLDMSRVVDAVAEVYAQLEQPQTAASSSS